ncbi:uncharacterized protein L969DRAFT_16655 [Mixia osmundae IAM 14324]|uniref:uncharacterized protein n=1 Tax=Mixia osmundae (strain CBS 9802 / IAM 14324 / JCM 22182 / KY 12970) TaxID=764103 RepID=UPI0004A547F8|nr:uncharacterized protein L969DRAFT_16655 [Mixia osmundae IAM 14324]KEI39980.1 hypothetical protein L969DRAFT_16655 [Mixia osmundae IAM 14324]
MPVATQASGRDILLRRDASSSRILPGALSASSSSDRSTNSEGQYIERARTSSYDRSETNLPRGQICVEEEFKHPLSAQADRTPAYDSCLGGIGGQGGVSAIPLEHSKESRKGGKASKRGSTQSLADTSEAGTDTRRNSTSAGIIWPTATTRKDADASRSPKASSKRRSDDVIVLSKEPRQRAQSTQDKIEPAKLKKSLSSKPARPAPASSKELRSDKLSTSPKRAAKRHSVDSALADSEQTSPSRRDKSSSSRTKIASNSQSNASKRHSASSLSGSKPSKAAPATSVISQNLTSPISRVMTPSASTRSPVLLNIKTGVSEMNEKGKGRGDAPLTSPITQARSPTVSSKARPSAAVSAHPDLQPSGGPVSRNLTSTGSGSRDKSPCGSCGEAIHGQFVRALGAVYHLDCFRCQDCQTVVAQKFFPVDGANGKQYPLCEKDYFKRLNLICAKCGNALRGSYITALDMKFHVEHFTCSVCPTVFGPSDSYYEHSGQVYCHFHYSTRFATKCSGCKSAILKQFVEINRNNNDEHWHPECYMISKFWNVRLAQTTQTRKGSTSPENSEATDEAEKLIQSRSTINDSPLPDDDYRAIEARETPTTLKENQKAIEAQVFKIWTILSTFEESSAACISEMLRHVSNGAYLDGVHMAERFVLHVEALFCALDDLSAQFRLACSREISHVREARMLCKKIVSFFSLLSQTQESGEKKMSITQDLLSLVTGLAHYLKILIRIALTASLRLERDYANKTAISSFLGKLDRLARDSDAIKSSDKDVNLERQRSYGYRSLISAVSTSNGQGEAASDTCESCSLTIEEECARQGTTSRWHLTCIKCAVCKRTAGKERSAPSDTTLPMKDFRIEPQPASSDQRTPRARHGRIYCVECSSARRAEAFEHVTRLEQYAYLLCVALNKLYPLLRQRGLASKSSAQSDSGSIHEVYKDSNDIKRMKAVNLNRKNSATARKPKRSTVIASPSPRSAPTESSSSSGRTSEARDAVSTTAPGVASAPIYARPPREQPPMLSPTPEPVTSPTRPTLSRTTTAVKIVDEPSPVSASARDGDTMTNAIRDSNGITLADLHQVMQAEQEKERHPSAAQHQNSGILLSELSALECFIVKHVAALTLAELPTFQEIGDLEDLLDIIEARKGNFWGKLFKGGNEKKAVKKKGVFGVPLEVLIERHGVDSLHGCSPVPVRVPSFVDDLISAMKQMDMSIEGVFRKNGNIRRLKELTDALDRDPTSVNFQDDNPVQLAALLKKFLRELPDPLMTFKLQNLWLSSQKVRNEADRKRIIHLICCLLPKAHRDTLEVIFVFLEWVASFSHVDEETGSKMDLHNLATVICPNILYARGKDPSRDESFLAIQAVHDLLQHQNEFWQTPEEFVAILEDQELFSNPSELTSKDILRRCEYFIRAQEKAREQQQVAQPRQPIRSRGEVQASSPSVFQSPSYASQDGHNGAPLASPRSVERNPYGSLSEQPHTNGHGTSAMRPQGSTSTFSPPPSRGQSPFVYSGSPREPGYL